MKSLIFFLSIFQSNFFFGQEYLNLINAKTATTISYWDEGENRLYHYTTSQEKYKNDKEKPISSAQTEYDIEFTVLEAADSFYIMQLEYSNFLIKNKDYKNFLDDEIESLQNGMKIRYKTNHLGQFDTILNISELILEFKTQIELVTEKIKQNLPKEISSKDFEEAIKLVSESFAEPQNIEVLFLDDIITFHGYFGSQLLLDKPEEFEIIYQGFNNIDMKGTGIITLTSINKDANSLVFTTNAAPSKEELNTYVKDVINMFTSGIAEKDPDMQDIKISSKSKGRYSMELTTGWVKLISETTTNTFTGKKEKIKIVTKKTIKLN